jgi:2-polyprenyl-3-methyl-5-hydroxy-6-metoxy-1,4-benzoquinol methylase
MLASLQEQVLRRLSRAPDAPEYPGGTARTNIDNALEFIEKTVPDFRQRIAGKDVLDFGCGLGHQTVAMARAGARRVTGVDLPRPFLEKRWNELRQLGLNNIEFRTGEITDQFDLAISCSSFEHFSDPGMILGLMRDRVNRAAKW